MKDDDCQFFFLFSKFTSLQDKINDWCLDSQLSKVQQLVNALPVPRKLVSQKRVYGTWVSLQKENIAGLQSIGALQCHVTGNIHRAKDLEISMI